MKRRIRQDKRGMGAIEMVLILSVTMVLVSIVMYFMLSMAPSPSKQLLDKVLLAYGASVKNQMSEPTWVAMASGYVSKYQTSGMYISEPDNGAWIFLDGDSNHIRSIMGYKTVRETLAIPVTYLKRGGTQLTNEDIRTGDLADFKVKEGHVFVGASAFCYWKANPGVARLSIDEWLVSR
jgi:hypothetical protein